MYRHVNMMLCGGTDGVAVQCNEEQHVHSAATSAADSFVHRQAKQKASDFTADVTVSQRQRS